MQSSIQPMADSFTNEHRSKRRWQKVFTVLAAVVVFCTTYALILPAITWERSLICELEEHTHTDACYEETVVDEPVISCGQEEHVHADGCFEHISVLVCGAQEHQHSDACYWTERVLVCEDDSHEHGDECYEDVTTLICGIKAHTHSDSCYETEDILVCNIPEHVHNEDCCSIVLQRTERVLVCGLEEHTHTDACFDAPPARDDGFYCGFIAHTHTEACYFEDGTLRCTIPEHEHTAICESNSKADTEDAAAWERTFNYVELTGVWADDVLAIADTQLGYCESTKNFDIEDGTRKGYTRYGAWYGIPYGDWCAMFCSFCINYAQVQDYPIDSGCVRWTEKLDALELYHPAGADEYEPKPGDLVFFSWNGFSAEHVGLVYEIVDDGCGSAKLRTIEGNWGNCVCYVERELDDECIFGWGEMTKNPELEEETVITEELASGRIRVSVTCDSEHIYLSAIPDGIDTDDYEWQWQCSENGGEPWEDILNANSLTHCMINSVYNALHYYRIVGTRMTAGPFFAPVLFAAIPDGTGSAPVLNAAVSQTKFFVSGAAAPMLAAGASRIEYYWVPVTNTSELTTDGVYILATNSNGNALYGDSQSTTAQADMTEVPGMSGYYSTPLGVEYWWKVSANGSPSTLQNIGTNKYLYLGSNNNNNVISGSNSSQISYSYSNNSWTLKNNSRNYWLRYNNSQFTQTAQSRYSSQMLIYKQVVVTVPDDDSGSGSYVAVKPQYPAYLPVSGGLEGTTVQNGVPGEYSSDPATSQLESLFSGTSSDDGKLLTDKSVIYGDDDYNVFENYDPNTFGVTLSALGQTYSLENEMDIPVPLDVVFVLDTSGSMVDTKIDNTNSANVMIEALNNVMSYVLDANDDNRVGVVSFSGGGHELLPLGHYDIDPNSDSGRKEYFPEGIYNPASLDKDTLTLAPNPDIQRTDLAEGETYSTGSFTGWWGTYTQHGIATGAQLFLDTDDTTVSGTKTETLGDGTITANYTIARRPVFILLSDGDPTYCTDQYDSVLGASHIFGNGNSGYDILNNLISKDVNNNKGIMGYYTILSAQYYKNRIARHYNTDAYFYSIGIGMYQSGSNSYSLSVSGDDYKRAVLNPTADNIRVLENCTNSRCNSNASVTDANRNISSYSDVTCHLLYQLLNDRYNSSTVKVSAYGDGTQEARYGVPGLTTDTANVIRNPYKTAGYDYADASYFTTMASVEELTNAFKAAVDVAKSVPVYGFILRNNTSVTISDTIGEGMEIKDAPILRYNGQNFTPVGEPTVNGNVTTYHYSGVSPVRDASGNPDGSGRAQDVSSIYAEVIDNDGQQTVRLIVPDSVLPTYFPNLNNEGIPQFYYEQLPARLVYQVGLTDEAKAEIGALAGTGESLTYYTNAWLETEDDDEYAYANFQPTSNNPYYRGDTYDKSDHEKSDNTTDTADNALEYDPSCDAGHVSQHLGNNGKLVFTSEEYNTIPLIIRKLDVDNNLITSDTAVFELFSDQELQNSLGTFTTDETGIISIPALRVDRTYYLVERKAPDTYEALAEAKSFTISDEGVISISGTDEYFSVANAGTGDDAHLEANVINDFGHVSVSAEKQWSELLDGEVRPASVEFQLYRDDEAYGLPVTLDEDSEWRYIWDNLPSVSIEDRHEYVYTVREIALDGYIAQTEVLEDGTTVITNQKLTPTSISAYKKWEGGIETSIQIELLRNGEPTGEYATLNADNNWWYEWTDLPDYDENGPLEYSVREFVPAGYDSEVHLWTGPGDPYGQTGGISVNRAYSFENGKAYILTYYDNGSYSALISNSSKNGLDKVTYTSGMEITNQMLWQVSKSGSDITFTNVYAQKLLVLDNNNRMALANSGRDTTWNFVEKDAWGGGSDYTLEAQYNRYRYYFNASVSGGYAQTSTNNWMFIYPYVYENTAVEDDVEKGDEHYIIVNTRQETQPSDLTLSFTKVDSEDNTALTGAVFALYRETGNEGDTLIPGTTDRYGVSYIPQWTSDGTAKTVTVTQNGTYYLVEVSPPDGYKPLTEPIVFEVSSDGSSRAAAVIYHPETVSGTGFTEMDIPNELFETYALPETGGAGILPIYALGVLLMAGAIMCGSFSRRKRERRNN